MTRHPVTPKVKWKKHYNFNLSGTVHPLSIMANDVQLSDRAVKSDANYCVGEGIYFNIANLTFGSYGVAEAVAEWKLPGTFVNRQPDNNCLAYFDVDTNLLTRSFITNGALTLPCWFVDGLSNATVSVTVRFRHGAGEWFTNEPLSGKFNIHRPTITDTNHYVDGTPTPVATNGFLSLGWGRDRDMSFRHQINPGNFSGQAGYTQIVGDSGDEIFAIESGSIQPFSPDNWLDTREYPRGQTSIPTSTNTWVAPFWDGPHVDLPGNLAQPYMKVHFHTYLLFTPDGGPGPNIPVPLRKIDWNIDDEATHYTDGWGVDKNTATITSDTNCIAFPHWSQLSSVSPF